MYNSMLSIRNTSLYWSKISSVVPACKTAWLASELLVSMGPSPHVWVLDAKWCLLDRNNKSLCVPDITCRFVHALQRDYHQKHLSLWVPALTFGFSVLNSDFWSVLSTKLKRQYCLQPSPMVLCMQNSDFRTRITSLCGSNTPPVVFECKRATSRPE